MNEHTSNLKSSINEVKKTISSQDSSINTCILSQTKDSKMIKDLQTHLAEELKSIKDSLNTKKVKQKKTGETKHEKKDSESHNFSEEFTKISEEIKRLQIGFAETVERETKLILQKTNSRFCEIEKNLNSIKLNFNGNLGELKEKLHWLPVNLNDIRGMPPSEARIFILEARLRSEENIRNEQYSKLLSVIDNIKVDIKTTSENSTFSHILPSIPSKTCNSETPDLISKETFKNFTSSIQSFIPSERLKLKLPKYNRISMSVDLSKPINSFRRKH